MIKVLTSLVYDDTLFANWVSHYVALGVDEIIVSVRPAMIHRKSYLEALCSTECWPVRFVNSCFSEIGLWDKGLDLSKDILRKQYTYPEDWIIPADLDEFIQFPRPLETLVEQLQHRPSCYLKGPFIDRISLDGRLTKLNASLGLWDQYPLACQIWLKLRGQSIYKVTLCRATCELGPGHHSVKSGSKAKNACFVHHFKWRKGVFEEMRARAEHFDKTKYHNWAKHIRVVLDYLEIHGGVSPQDFNAKLGWRPDLEAPFKKLKRD